MFINHASFDICSIVLSGLVAAGAEMYCRAMQADPASARDNGLRDASSASFRRRESAQSLLASFSSAGRRRRHDQDDEEQVISKRSRRYGRLYTTFIVDSELVPGRGIGSGRS